MVSHIPGLLVLSDLEPPLCVSVFSLEADVDSSLSLATALAEGFLCTTRRKGHLLVPISAGEMVGI
jgi:hypothetical protein